VTVGNDALVAKLASLCRDALSRHLAGPLASQPTPPSPPHLPLEVVAAVERLEGREPDNTDTVKGDCRTDEAAERSLPASVVSRFVSAPPNEIAGEVLAV
jgi:hypothetical protein